MNATRSIRPTFALVFLACAGLLGYAYYAQYVMHLEPCPLCMLQRLGFMLMALAALAGWIHGPRGGMRWLYAVVIWAGGIWGAITSGRHVWLQSLPPDQVPECGPGLGFMIEYFSLGEALREAFTGAGECAEVDWSFLGLSMPAWTLIWYVALVLITLYGVLRAGK